MSLEYHILVEAGTNVGERYAIPNDGAILGRQSISDITITDPSISRQQCRFFFKTGALWVANLSDSNETLLNGDAVTESAMACGDRIVVGDTILSVINASQTDAMQAGQNTLVLKAAMEIPGYTILSKLGEGSTAIVWLARQDSLDRKVALKVLKGQLSKNPQDVEDFINEAKAVARIHSRSIIQVIDVGQHEATCYFVMEYIEGKPLGQVLAADGRFDQKRALTIAAEIATALDEAWKSGHIIHRDIKPDNIILQQDGSIKIADLGLAGILDQENEAGIRSDEIAGTPNYMAPEQGLAGGDIDYRSDMYSVGATLYHMITGVVPFAGEDQQSVLEAQQSRQLRNPRDIVPSITPGCAQIMIKLMMKKPKYRFKDWSAAAKELHKIASGKLVVTKVPASATSTIAAVGAIAPNAQSPVIVRRPRVAAVKNTPTVASQQRLTELKKKYMPQRAPTWLRVPLELALLGWFGWLAYQLIWLPSHPVAAPPPTVVSRQTMPSMNTTPEEPTTTPPRTAPPVRIKQVVLPERPSTPTPIVTTAPPQEPLIEQPGDVLTPPQKRNIVATLLTSGPQAARLVLQNAASGSPESRDVTELTELLTSDALAPVGVAAVLNETVGTRIAIMLGSNKRYLEVKSVLGEQITADMFMAQSSSATKRPISFNVQQLDPMEQSRLLGAPTRPDRALAKFVLHMNAGDFVTARSLAAHCGPLADACKAEADARIQVLVQ